MVYKRIIFIPRKFHAPKYQKNVLFENLPLIGIFRKKKYLKTIDQHVKGFSVHGKLSVPFTDLQAHSV